MKKKADPTLAAAVTGILTNYAISGATHKPTSTGVTNTSFFVFTKQGEYVLRIYSAGSRLLDVKFEVDLLDTLSRSGIVVPHVLRNKQGGLVTKVRVNSQERHVILMQKLPGRIVAAKDHKLVSVIAKAHAKLHVATAKLIQPRRSVAKTMEGTYVWFTGEVTQAKKHLGRFSSAQEFFHQAEDMQKFLQVSRRVITRLPSAECHLDYDSDNILTNGKKVTAIIDFGDVTHAPLVMDLGNSLCWWLFCNPQRFGQGILSRYLAAYSRVRPFTDQEKALLPAFIKLRNLGLAAYFYQHGLRSGTSYLQKTVQFNKFVDTLRV